MKLIDVNRSLAIGMICFFASIAVGLSEVTVVDRPETTSTNSFYVGNRAPLAASPFYKLSMGAITPKGWLREQLELERDGMTGHLEEISPWLDFTKSSWADPQGRGKFGWEELPYWLKGYGDLGYVLKDAKIEAGEKVD
jgi:hypothetical protein